MDPIKQLRFAALAVITLLALGTAGYVLVEGWPTLTALYMTVITLTGIGYGLPRPLSHSGVIFTIIFALSGFAVITVVVFWALGNIVELAAAEKLEHLFWRRKMESVIKGVKDHYIICGYGRMGQAIAAEFRARKVPFVIVENNPEQLHKLVSEKSHFVEGDATDEQTLLEAGVERAKGLISVAPTDADNTFIVLTAKGINPKIFAVARSIKVEDEPKLRRAGADRVMSPYILGGKRMAWAVLRPTVVDFLDSAMYSESLELEISEFVISSSSEFMDKTIRESGIREKSGATVIAIRSRGGALTHNPSPDIELREGDVMVAMGTPRHLESLQKMV